MTCVCVSFCWYYDNLVVFSLQKYGSLIASAEIRNDIIYPIGNGFILLKKSHYGNEKALRPW